MTEASQEVFEGIRSRYCMFRRACRGLPHMRDNPRVRGGAGDAGGDRSGCCLRARSAGLLYVRCRASSVFYSFWRGRFVRFDCMPRKRWFHACCLYFGSQIIRQSNSPAYWTTSSNNIFKPRRTSGGLSRTSPFSDASGMCSPRPCRGPDLSPADARATR